MQNNRINDHDIVAERLTSLSQDEFLHLGAGGLSYIKPIVSTNGDVLQYSLHSASGKLMAAEDSIALLKAIAAQNGMMPMMVQ